MLILRGFYEFMRFKQILNEIMWILSEIMRFDLDFKRNYANLCELKRIKTNLHRIR